MNQAQLEVILRAQNQAGAVLNQFGAQVRQTMERASMHVGRMGANLQGAGRSAIQAGGALNLFAGSAQFALGTVLRLGGVLLSVGGMIVGVVGQIVSSLVSLASQVISVAGQIVSWIGGKVVLAFKVAAAAAVGFAAAVAAGGYKAISAASQMETYRMQFVVLTGSVEEAEKRLAKLVKFAAETPFSLQGVIEADRLVQAFNLDIGGIEKTLTTFGDAAAGMGVPIQEVIPIMAKLKAGMFEIEQMARLGITRPGLRQFGIEFTKAGEVINREDLFPAAIKLLSRFSGMMAAMMGTVAGKAANVGDAFFQMSAAAGKALLPLTRGVLERITGVFAKLQGVIERIGASDRFQKFLAEIEVVAGRVFDLLEQKVEWLGQNWPRLWALVGSWIQKGAEWIAGAVGAMGGAFDYLRNLLGVSENGWAGWAAAVITVLRRVGLEVESWSLDIGAKLLRLAHTLEGWLPFAGAAVGGISKGSIGAIAGLLGGIAAAYGLEGQRSSAERTLTEQQWDVAKRLGKLSPSLAQAMGPGAAASFEAERKRGRFGFQETTAADVRAMGQSVIAGFDRLTGGKGLGQAMRQGAQQAIAGLRAWEAGIAADAGRLQGRAAEAQQTAARKAIEAAVKQLSASEQMKQNAETIENALKVRDAFGTALETKQKAQTAAGDLAGARSTILQRQRFAQEQVTATQLSAITAWQRAMQEPKAENWTAAFRAISQFNTAKAEATPGFLSDELKDLYLKANPLPFGGRDSVAKFGSRPFMGGGNVINSRVNISISGTSQEDLKRKLEAAAEWQANYDLAMANQERFERSAAKGAVR